MGVLGAIFIVALLRLSTAQDPNCDYIQYAQEGTVYYVTNREYDRNYTGPQSCRWIAVAPDDSFQIVLDCPEILLPTSAGCSRDRLLISRSGDPQLSSADVYCGRGTTTALSTGRQLSIGLIAPSNTVGGRFYCQLRVQRRTTTPTCSCGYKKRNRIVGGQETGVNEYPMMAGLVDKRIVEIKCGATIIDKRYLLTAAHCVAGLSPINFSVVVGEHNIDTGDSPATMAYNVDRFIIHPQYNPSNYDYDIAVVRVLGTVAFGDRVGPACLPFRLAGADLTGSTLTFLGWGTLFFGGPKPRALQKVDLPVISQASCRQRIPTLTARQFCTYAAGKDTCQDDSGGPGLRTDTSNGRLYVWGVISQGRSCASEYPGISTRVDSLLAWIQSVTTDAVYCMI